MNSSLLTLWKLGESQSAIMPNGRGEKEGSKEVIDWLKFWLTFGFWAPAKYKIDFAAEKIVGIKLASLEAKADARKAMAEVLEREIHELDDPKELIAKRSAWLAAKETCREEETVLRDACQVAVRCGFRPVARYQYIWDREQEKERARRLKRAKA